MKQPYGLQWTSRLNNVDAPTRMDEGPLKQRACVATIWTVSAMLLLAPLKVLDADLVTYAFIQNDGTLRMKGRTIRLYGIHIPSTDRICQGFTRPLKCGSRAALALSFKKGANFVSCEPVSWHADGSLTAVCRVKGEDLAAYLLERGWALALPDAPFEYTALERIARRRGIGVWGIPLGETSPFRLTPMPLTK